MASEIRCQTGEVIEFADKGKFHLGVVVSVDEKTGKVKLIHATGREMTLPPKQVLHVLKKKVSVHLPSSQIQNEMGSLEMRAGNMAVKCDIEELWQLVTGEYDEISLEELVSLVYDVPEAVHQLAMIRALRDDKIYFKSLQPELFAPRPAAVVADLLRQRELKAQKDAWRLRFADEAAQVMAMMPEERVQAMEDDILPVSDVLDAWKMVEQYAVLGSEAADKAEAECLMDVLRNRLNRGFSGTAHLCARAFLREVGYWAHDVNVALLKYEISTSFEDWAEKDAFALYQKNTVNASRRDLTHLNVFSIDDAETLDVDDALSVERLEGGLVQLGVHITAPAASLAFDGMLEREARHRATSIYLPEQRIPMLPAILSENALSLLPNQKRNAISFMMTFDAEASLVRAEIVPSVVMSRHKLSYDSAEHLIEEGNDVLSDEIRLIQEITECSAQNRRSHGAIDIDLPEFKLTWDADEQRYSLHPIEPGMMSRQLVAECMILANSLAADFCAEHHIPALYRLQPPPVNMPTEAELESLPNDLMRAYAMRRCMQPASSSMTPGFHAGLGLPRYLQATSPLRRYTDLMCHYQLESWFETGAPKFDTDTFNAVLSETDLGLSHAKSASSEGYHTATLAYLKQLGSTPLDAVIVQYLTERGDMAQVVLVQTQLRVNVATKNRWPLGTMCTVYIDNVQPEEGALIVKFGECK